MLGAHLVTMSPWPIIAPTAAASLMVMGAADFMGHPFKMGLFLGGSILLLISAVWWRDILREGTEMGDHTKSVQHSLCLSMAMFITSEALFFGAFFWAFFHMSLSPAPDPGCTWPPSSINSLNPLSVPLLNTLVLVSSGVTMTLSHGALIENNHIACHAFLWATIMLGMFFTYLQCVEYLDTGYSFNDSNFGSSFYIATGFHGAHVIIGTTFLLVTVIRMSTFKTSSGRHLGFELAAWYWHFVDAIWLFLYMSLYNWNIQMEAL